MTYNEWRQTITQTLVDYTTSRNMKLFTDNRKAKDITDVAIKFDLVYGPTTIEGYSTRNHTEQNGNIAIRILAPLDSGSSKSYEVAEELQNLLQFTQWDANTHTKEAQLQPSTNPDFYQLNLLIRFEIDK